MAESIIIHFNEHDPARIISRIEARFGSSADGIWRFPRDNYLILVSAYKDFDVEYETSERDELCTKLGGGPSASFDFQIRRSLSDDACDVLEQFIRHDLQGLNFVVDDMWRFLSCREIESTHDLLDLYRYKKQAEQARPANSAPLRR